MRRLPAEFGPQLGGVDRVTAVVAGTIPHTVEIVRILAHHGQDVAQHGDVVAFPVRADQVRLTQTALRQDRPHRTAVVLRVDPVAHVQPVAVQLGTDALQDVRDLTWDELLHMLVRAVVVGAVRNRHAHAERAVPSTHQQVGRGFRRRIRARRTVRRLLGEPVRVVQRQITIHLVRAHMVVAYIVLAGRLQQAIRASTFVLRNGSGSAMELSLCDSAA